MGSGLFSFPGGHFGVGFSFPGGHFGVGFSFPGGHFGVGRFARGKGARSYEARFSPSRSPFPGTSLFCAVVWSSILANACMLLYWPCTAVPMVCAGRKAVCAADLFLVVVVFLALTCFLLSLYCWHSPVSACCCIAGADQLPPVVVASLA